MKKTVLFILWIAMILLAAGSLAACSLAASTTAPAIPSRAAQTPAADAAQPVELIWYVRSDRAEQKWQTETVIPAFEKAHPEIKIKLYVVPRADFDTKMQTMIAAGTPPDIWSHSGASGFQDYVKRNLVADLTPYIQKDHFDTSDFTQPALNTYIEDGKILGLPMDSSGSYIYYNKNLFDQAGVAYPPTNWDDSSWTWDAFIDKCTKLSRVRGILKIDIYGCDLAWQSNEALAWMFGADIYPQSSYLTGLAEVSFLDDPQVIKAFQAYQDMIWVQQVTHSPEQSEALGGADKFAGQRAAIVLNDGSGWWNYRRIKDFQWAVAALPYGSKSRKDVISTDPWLLSSISRHPEAAWTFLKYLVSPEVQKSWSLLTGAPPVRKSLLEEWYQSFPNMQPEAVKEVFQGSLKYGKESPGHRLVQYAQFDQILQSALGPVFNNEKKPKDVFPDANRKLMDALQHTWIEYKQ